MKIIIYITILLNISFSLPKFSVYNSSSCLAFHVNPTGSGLRNSYGNDIVSLEELPIEKWINKGDDSWTGYINEHIQLGGDFRLQGVQFNDTDTTRKTIFFPMQADIYTFLKINQTAGIFTKIGARGRSSFSTEFWILLNSSPNKAWIKIGKSLPNYGLRVDDHTSFIRGGNYSNKFLELEKEGLIFGPYLDSPAMIETGIPILKNMLWTTSLSNGIKINSSGANNVTTQINYINQIGNRYKYMAGINYMKENEFMMMGIYGGLSFYKFIYTFEFDQADNLIDNFSSIANYHQFSYQIIQGIDFLAKYDFFDPDKDMQTNAIARYSLGFEIYPLNILEIKLQVRVHELIKPTYSEFQEAEYLIQTHFWF